MGMAAAGWADGVAQHLLCKNICSTARFIILICHSELSEESLSGQRLSVSKGILRCAQNDKVQV